MLSHIPTPPAVTLLQRLKPLSDARIGLTLLSTFLFFAAAFTIYAYLSVVFDRALTNPSQLGWLLVLWGGAGTISNLLIGRLVDSVGSRKVLVAMLVIVIADFVLRPGPALISGRPFPPSSSGALAAGACSFLSSTEL